jgi:hypothetical protein
MSNNGHVADVCGLVHEGPDLVYIAESRKFPPLRCRLNVLDLPTVKLLVGEYTIEHR